MSNENDKPETIDTTRKQGHSALRVRDGKLDKFDLHPLAKQRVSILERVMKLSYIKATRDTEEGEQRFVCRDDVITVLHELQKE